VPATDKVGELPHLTAIERRLGHNHLVNPKSCSDRLGDQMCAIEQQQVGRVATHDRATACDERVVAAGDPLHSGRRAGIRSITLWYDVAALSYDARIDGARTKAPADPFRRGRELAERR